MKKKIKKAFTLVELLVVIAILAILATVSIVGYSSFTKKAHESNDISLTTQMNSILQAEEVSNKPATPHDAIKQLANGGVEVEKLTPTTDGYSYVYDLDANRMILLNEKKEAIAPTNIGYTKDLSVFTFVENENEISNWEGYSIYLKSDFTFNSTNTLTVSSGVDVGDNLDQFTITYQGNDNKNVLFRTNKGNLIINSNSDNVKHYGVVEELTINSTNDSFIYSEYGTVVELKSMEKGTFNADDSAVFVQDKSVVDNLLSNCNSNISDKTQYSVISPVSKVVAESDFIDYVANGGNYTVANSITLNEFVVVKAGKEAIIDLEGKKLTQSADEYTIVVENGGKLTIKNGSFSNPTSAKSSLIDNFGTLIIEKGTYIGNGSSVIKNEPGASLVINGGDFQYSLEATPKTIPAAIISYGDVKITGGNFETSSDVALNIVDLSARDNKNGTGAIHYKSNVEISGGTFKGSKYAIKSEYDDTINISGGVFLSKVFCKTTKTYNSSLKISGGEFHGEVTSANVISGGTFLETSYVRITKLNEGDEVTGGTFLGKTEFGPNIQITGGDFGSNTKFKDTIFSQKNIVVDVEKNTSTLTNDVPTNGVKAIVEDKVNNHTYYYVGTGAVDKLFADIGSDWINVRTDYYENLDDCYSKAQRIVILFERPTIETVKAQGSYASKGTIFVAGTDGLDLNDLLVKNSGVNSKTYDFVTSEGTTSDGKQFMFYYYQLKSTN